MAPRQRSKSCDYCQNPSSALFRVRPGPDAPWVFVCEACFPALKQRHPDYTYGGTWKATKK